MKFITYHLQVLLFLVLGHANTFGQAKWAPKKIDIIANATGIYTQTSECKSEVPDTSWNAAGSLELFYSDASYNYSNYSRHGDTIRLEYQNNINSFSINCFSPNKISFYFDSVEGKIKDFLMNECHVDFAHPLFGGNVQTSIHISSINCVLSNDSLFIANEQGVAFKNNIAEIKGVAYWQGQCSLDPGPHHGQWTKEINLSTLSTDTIGFNCSMIFVIPEPVNVVKSLNSIQQKLIVFSSLFDNSINFSFPSNTNSQSISIYDILGREINRIEIPFGASVHNISRDQLTRGYYIARLGNLSASFVVN